MIFGINTTHDISKLSQISLAYRLVKLHVTILKYQYKSCYYQYKCAVISVIKSEMPCN